MWEARNTEGTCFECRDSLHASLPPSPGLGRILQGSLLPLRAGLFFYTMANKFFSILQLYESKQATLHSRAVL